MSAAKIAAAPRKQVRLSGPTVALEDGRYAVRRDLAELEVAGRVFAQHYAEPMAVVARADAVIHTHPDRTSAAAASLTKGDFFYVVDIGQSWAWGRGDAAGTVGYVDTTALDLP